MVYILGRQPELYRLDMQKFDADTAALYNGYWGPDPLSGSGKRWYLAGGRYAIGASSRVSCAIHPGRPIYTCGHVLQNDPVHPWRVFLLPTGLFICKTCMNLMENRKYDFQNDTHVNCFHCVQDAVQALTARDPTLFVDLRKVKA